MDLTEIVKCCIIMVNHMITQIKRSCLMLNKLNYYSANQILDRPRIDILLSKAMEHSLAIVSAGAGYGKTQAVSMYLNSKDFRVAWIPLTKLDNLSLRFWNKIINAISYKNRNALTQLELLGFPDTLTKFDHFLRIFANEIYTGEKYILVLDDLHIIYDKSVMSFIENIIYAGLENFCLILISRTKPDLDFSNISDNASAIYIEQDDLCFTLSETREYLKINGLKLSQNIIEKIYVNTEGWPLALYLVALSSKKGDIISDNPMIHAMPYIFEMIDKELFSDYSAEIQYLLIQLSLPNELPTGLVKKLTADKFETIMEIMTTNMFIQYNHYDKNFHFHHLYLDFLNSRHLYLKENEIYQTYLKTADWYLDNERKFDAYAYYDKCGRHDKILDIMENYGSAIFPRETADFLIDLIKKFPEDFVKQHPAVHFIRAGILINNAEFRTAMKELSETEKYLNALPPSDKVKAILGEIYILLGLVSFAQCDCDMKYYIKKACDLLPNGSKYFDSTGRALNTKNAIMLNSASKGALREMEELLFETIPYISKVMNGYATGLDYLASAEAAYFTGNMNKSVQNAYKAIYRARELNIDDIVSSGYFLLTRIAFVRGNYKDVAANLDQLKDYVNSLENGQTLQYMADIANSWLYVMIDQVDKVTDWIMDDILSNKMIAPYSIGRDRMVRAICYLKQGRYYELLAWLDPYEKLVRHQNMLLILLDIQIQKAIAYYHINEESQAFYALQAAYDLAHENNLIMQFVEFGNDMRSLTNAAKRSKEHNIPKEWLDKIHSKATTYVKRLTFIKAEYSIKDSDNHKGVILTKREREVLFDLCQGLTREETARSLNISNSTVKTILNNIYSKLGALNSADAIRKAIKMKII